MKEQDGPFKISQKIKKLTTKCSYDFECTVNHHWDTCSISGKLKDKGLFIEKKSNRNTCAYNLSFGKTHLCQCPARYEIFKRYTL